MSVYPTSAADRDRFVVELRGARLRHDPWRYQDVLVEDERTATGIFARTATVFLTGRECPWRCVMCDLWRHTTTQDTPVGAIPAQLAAARDVLSARGETIRQVKLYNAGSFFDPRAVPDADYAAVAEWLHGFDRVVVESHPSLVGRRVDRLLKELGGRARQETGVPQLEVAMGLETAHPVALDRLHKRMTVDDFARAAGALRARQVDVRTFLLIAPPFVPVDEHDTWLVRSIDAAFSAGASAVSLIPTRAGNGAMEALAAEGVFTAPTLGDIERSVDLAHTHMAGRGRIFVDTWDLDQFATCPQCFTMRRERLRSINLRQQLTPAGECSACGFRVRL